MTAEMTGIVVAMVATVVVNLVVIAAYKLSRSPAFEDFVRWRRDPYAETHELVTEQVILAEATEEPGHQPIVLLEEESETQPVVVEAVCCEDEVEEEAPIASQAGVPVGVLQYSAVDD